MDIKKEVLNVLLSIEGCANLTNHHQNFVLSSDDKNGDVSFPCFVLAKELKQSPVAIAENLVNSINSAENLGIIDHAEAVNGYVNIFINKAEVSKKVISEIIAAGSNFGKDNFGQGKTVVLDYSSVNLAKYMHIGHLKTTIIGAVIKNMLQNFGFNTVSINYVGDYGTPFGKMITAYKRWGTEEDVKKRGVDAVQDLYVKFNQECETDKTLEVEAREWFKKIENKNAEAVALQNWFIDLSRHEVKRLCDLLGAQFDSWRGENYYSDKMQPVINELTQKNLLVVSEGAQVVDLTNCGLGIALIQKSDGTSLYLTRDLAAVQDRFDNYKFDRAIYVTDVAQKLHFKQLFEIVNLLNKPYKGTLEHVSYGRYSLPTGKISSRLGKQALLADIYNAAEEKSKEIMLTRGTKVNDVNEVAKQVAVGAISFEAIKNERVKDSVFDMEASLNFDGETSPYMQYTYARCCSIIEKANTNINALQLNYENINSVSGFGIVKLLNKYPQVLLEFYNKNEPCLLVKHLMSICSELNKFYNNNRIIDNNVVNTERFAIIAATKQVLENGFNIINIPAIKKM